MRVMILAAAVLAMTSLSAAAAPWSDPDGRLSFEVPDGWMVAPQSANGMTYVVTGGMTSECHLIAAPRAGTADAQPHRIRAAAQTQIDADAWHNVTNLLPNLFPQNAEVISLHDVDTRPFWPVQRADIRGLRRVVHGAIQFRPGFELWGFCMTHDGADDVATFERVLASVGTPNDATLQAEAVRLAEEQDQMMRAAQLYREGNRANALQIHREGRMP